jgi:hypothetical protein
MHQLCALAGGGRANFDLPGKLAEFAYRPSREIAVSLLNRHRAGGFDPANAMYSYQLASAATESFDRLQPSYISIRGLDYDRLNIGIEN